MIEPNDVFKDDKGGLWRVVAVATEPTMTLERMYPLPQQGTIFQQYPAPPVAPERLSGVIGSPLFAKFVRLAPAPE